MFSGLSQTGVIVHVFILLLCNVSQSNRRLDGQSKLWYKMLKIFS